jgi:hypothetical protein
MKMNLKDIMSTLNRDEMKKIMAGSGGTGVTCKTGCGCHKWPATTGCHCTVENWWGDSQGASCNA